MAAFQEVLFPLPFIPSRPGRGNMTFYAAVKIEILCVLCAFAVDYYEEYRD
jgi:hypothetical protein